MRITSHKALGVLSNAFTFRKPHHVQWLLTRKCNYRCKGCSIWLDQQEEELPAEEIKRGLDVLKRLGVIEIVLSGGNPLLREDIDEILDYASRFFITTIYDNGSTASHKVETLRNADFVAISLDSLNPKVHDYIKGVKGAWKQAMKSIETLYGNGVNVAVSPTISQLNIHEIPKITEYFTERGIPVWYCLYSYDDVPLQDSLFSIGRKKKEFEIKEKNALVKLCDILIEMRRQNKGILITTKVLKTLKRYFSDRKRSWKCAALRNFLVIDHLGRVSGCHLLDPICSVFELPEKWNTSEFENLRRKYARCVKCTYLCYIFYSLHGSLIQNLELTKDQLSNASWLMMQRRFAKTLCF
jgi:MoaA/NifB/PqqE/SkfB family radical SAM enzyme